MSRYPGGSLEEGPVGILLACLCCGMKMNEWRAPWCAYQTMVALGA